VEINMSKRQMLINYVPGEECRIAITENGHLEELYHERASTSSHVGNIYTGRVTNVEASIQAAFIDFGLERNGFLHISDLHPMYFPGNSEDDNERVGKKTPRRDRPPIQQALKRGDKVLVQVLKEGIGTKGPTLTSYLSIPGRFLVMMPNMEKMGVSRKVEDDQARRDIRQVLNELNPPEGFGFIIRTAGIGRTKIELKRDLAYLHRLWKTIDTRRKTTNVGELYTESDLIIRTIRDVYTSDIERIIVDHQGAAQRVRDFLHIITPRTGANVMVYSDSIPIFHRFDIESQIESINHRTVPLPSGGSLVIDSTEALVAIDVNSGKMRDHRDAETTAYKTNLEATDEICRQLRLRDLGGVVVNDLIDMRDLKYRRTIEQRFRDNLKNDRARTRILPISQFGILEMTRQRMRPSLTKSIYTDCPACSAEGMVKSTESVVLNVTRRLGLALHHEKVTRIELTVSPDVAFYLLNNRRGQLVTLENRYGKPVMVRVSATGPVDYVDLSAYDARGSLVEAENVSKLPPPQLTVVTTGPLTGEEIEPEVESDLDVDHRPGEAAVEVNAEQAPRPKRRRRRRSSKPSTSTDGQSTTPGSPDSPDTPDGQTPPTATATTDVDTETSADEQGPPKRKRPRRRSRRKKSTATSVASDSSTADDSTATVVTPATTDSPPNTSPDTHSDDSPAPRKRSRRRGGRRHRKKSTTINTTQAVNATPSPPVPPTPPAPAPQQHDQ